MEQQKNILKTVIELRQGSWSAFEKIYNLYSGKLYNFILRLSHGDTYMAEEIVQTTFIRLWEIHKQIDIEKPLISYLCTIAKNQLMNIYQHQTVEHIYQEYFLGVTSEHDNQTEYTLDLNFLEEYLDRLSERLPPIRQKVFNLSKRQHFSNKEIAEMMQISESSVATHLSLAVQFVRKKIQIHYDKMRICILIFLFIKN
ncbi:MAG: RNA polymerase sigma-70 factor [Bacteroidales bacterium]